MYAIQQKIIDKVNENQEADVVPYTWETIPLSLRRFWLQYLANQQKSTDTKQKKAKN
jgi:hypothetical protein